MAGRKLPIASEYKKIAELVYLKGRTVKAACEEVGRAPKTWYAHLRDVDLQEYIAELKEIKAKRGPEEDLYADELLEMALKNIKQGLKDKDPRVTELVIRNMEKLKSLGKQEIDLATVYELMYEGGITLDNIKIPDEQEDDTDEA
jgi:hypothetical protein